MAVLTDADGFLQECLGEPSGLTLLVGSSGCGKTASLRLLAAAASVPVQSVSLAISRTLLAAPDPASLVDTIERVPLDRTSPLLLDNIEILFCAKLHVDPIRWLLGQARLCPAIASWPGAYRNGVLTFGSPAHPEFQSFSQPTCRIVPLEG